MGEILPIRENLHFSLTFNIATKFKEQRANFSFDFNYLPLHKLHLNSITAVVELYGIIIKMFMLTL